MRRLLVCALAFGLLASACTAAGPSILPPTQPPGPSDSFDPFAGLPTNPPQPALSPCPVAGQTEMELAAAGLFYLEIVSPQLGPVDAPLAVTEVDRPDSSISPLRLPAASGAAQNSLPDLGGVLAGGSAALAVYQTVSGDTLVRQATSGSAAIGNQALPVSGHGGGLILVYPALTEPAQQTLQVFVSWGDGCHLFRGSTAFRLHRQT